MLIDWTPPAAISAPAPDDHSIAGAALMGLVGLQPTGTAARGTWTTADGRIMLERRRCVRPATVTLQPGRGAIEATAGRWLDGMSGVPAEVEAVGVLHRPANTPRIDWGIHTPAA
jgi:hypothetical protein